MDNAKARKIEKILLRVRDFAIFSCAVFLACYLILRLGR